MLSWGVKLRFVEASDMAAVIGSRPLEGKTP